MFSTRNWASICANFAVSVWPLSTGSSDMRLAISTIFNICIHICSYMFIYVHIWSIFLAHEDFSGEFSARWSK